MENDAWGSSVSYIVTECAGVAFYINHVENAGEPHSSSRSYVLLVVKINMTRTEKKARKFYKLILAKLIKAMNNFIFEKNACICIPVMH